LTACRAHDVRQGTSLRPVGCAGRRPLRLLHAQRFLSFLDGRERLWTGWMRDGTGRQRPVGGSKHPHDIAV
ncbi:hypothetical protein ACYOEI_06405, partial [Singulisphaera rosea]